MQRGTKKLFQMLNMFIILIVVMFHKCVHNAKTYQILHFEYMCFIHVSLPQ